MTLRDGWNTASLRIRGNAGVLAGLDPEILSLGTSNKVGTALIIPIENREEELRIEERLERVEVFLNVHRAALSGVPNAATLEVFLGWSPRSPQESFTLEVGLILLLADFRASIIFDTYSE